MTSGSEFSPEFSNSKIGLAEFVLSRQDAPAVQSYYELQDILRGQREVPQLLSDYVHEIGERKVNDLDMVSVQARVKVARYLVHATVDYRHDEPKSVTITSRANFLPLIRYSRERRLVTLQLQDPTWDQVVTRLPHLERYSPSSSSPKSINFWASKGEHPVYTNDGRLPSTTTGQIARDATANAFETFNGFLDTTVLLVDQLLSYTRK